jgi:hypothetical protein
MRKPIICTLNYYKRDQIREGEIGKCENKPFRFSSVKSKAVPLHAMVALRGRGGIAPTHS